MKVAPLKRLLTVFGDDGPSTVSIDKIQFVFSPTPRFRPPSDDARESRIKAAAAIFAAHHDATMERVRYRRRFIWEQSDPAASVQLGVGDMFPGDRWPDVTQVIATNPLRYLAAHYASIGAINPPLPLKRNKEPDNYVPPFRVNPEVISRDTFAFLERFTVEHIKKYCDAYEQLYGMPLPPEEVRVSIRDVELTWDRTCEAAIFAPLAFWRPWANRFHEAAFHNKGQYITANAAEGERYKLYAKTGRVLRFEVSLGRAGIRRLLGCSIRPRDRVAFEVDVRRLAGLTYPRILDVQENVVPQYVVDVAPLLRTVLRSRADPVLRVLEPIASGGLFKKAADDESAGRLLRAMRDSGLVARSADGKGYWRPSGELEELLRHLRYRSLSLGALGPDAPTADRSMEGCEPERSMPGPREMHTISSAPVHGSKTAHSDHRASGRTRGESSVRAARKS